MNLNESLKRVHHWAVASRSASFIVLRDGTLLDQVSFERTTEPTQLMSITKMVTGIALGQFLDDYGISIDQPLSEFFPEWRQGRKQHITVAMLLNHTSGIQNEPNADAELESAPDWIQLALCAELVSDPGTRFAYNNKAVLLIAGLVERVTGKPLDYLVTDVLFHPLGITQSSWFRDDRGTPYVCGGLAMRGSDLARVGQLLLDDGVVCGTQVVSPGWISQMTAPGTLRPDFGLLCRRWISPLNGSVLGIYHDGWLGQYLVVCPQTRTVIVRLIARSEAPQVDSEDMLSLIEPLAYP